MNVQRISSPMVGICKPIDEEGSSDAFLATAEKSHCHPTRPAKVGR